MKRFSIISSGEPLKNKSSRTIFSNIIRPALLAVSMLLLMTIPSKGQNIIQVKFSVGADVNVFITRDSSMADLIAYVTLDTTGIGPNNGTWYFGNDPTKKKVYFTDDNTAADFKVYFTGNSANAGWINSAKSYLMN